MINTNFWQTTNIELKNEYKAEEKIIMDTLNFVEMDTLNFAEMDTFIDNIEDDGYDGYVEYIYPDGPIMRIPQFHHSLF
jgi:hypothetical protein